MYVELTHCTTLDVINTLLVLCFLAWVRWGWRPDQEEENAG